MAVPPSRKLEVALLRIAQELAVAAGVIALLVLLGWATGSMTVTAWIPGETSMSPVTAITFLAAAATLLIESMSLRVRRHRRWHLAAVSGAWLVIGVGAIILGGYALGGDLGVEQILFQDWLGGHRVAPNTGFSFLLLGAALLVLDHPGKRYESPAQLLALAPATMALVSLVGYLFGVRVLFVVGAPIPMALPTAVAFFALALGILFVRPNRGLVGVITSEEAGGRLARLLLPPAILVPLVLAWLRLEGERRGLYGLEFGTAALAVVQLLIFVTLVWFVSVSQNRSDVELKRTRDAAEAATRVKAAFLATMSHEIRTPLNAIIGMARLLEDTRLDEEQREFIHTTRQSGEHLLTLVNDILDFSKVESGSLTLQRQPFNVRNVVEESLDLVANRAGEKGLELTYFVDADVPEWALGDAGRIKQILLNLLSNAVKFTEEGEVGVTIEVQETVLDDVVLHVEVHDTGVGIPSDQFPRLFRSFSQLDTSATRSYGGTGLGLAISRQLAELMEGRIWVESEVGEGSRFHVTLRVPMTDMPETEQHVPFDVLRGARALVVDDNETNRRLLEVLGDRWGMVVRSTESAEGAKRILRTADPVDVVLLDYVLAEVDGVTLARQIQDIPARAKTPLMLLSSVGRRPENLRADEHLFATILPKPVRQSQLLDALLEALPGHGPAVTRRVAPKPGPAPAHLRVLLVEDNPVNRRVALKMMEKLGLKADTATNGREAIERIEQRRYDIALMDVQMPVMDGLDATREICRRWPRAERPRIVAMTAEAMQGDRERCLEAGMDDYLTKPVSLETLSAVLGLEPLATPPPVEEPEAGALDSVTLNRLERDMGGAEALRELIDSYLEEATQLISTLRRAVTTNDKMAAQRAAHTLRSTSLSFGARPLGNAAREVEILASQDRLSDAGVRLPEIEEAFVRVRARLEQRLKDGA